MNRYVKIILDYHIDKIHKILKYSDSLVDMKTIDNNAYYVDFVGVTMKKYLYERELILDLEYDVHSLQDKVDTTKIVKNYNKYKTLYLNYIREQKFNNIINE